MTATVTAVAVATMVTEEVHVSLGWSSLGLNSGGDSLGDDGNLIHSTVLGVGGGSAWEAGGSRWLGGGLWSWRSWRGRRSLVGWKSWGGWGRGGWHVELWSAGDWDGDGRNVDDRLVVAGATNVSRPVRNLDTTGQTLGAESVLFSHDGWGNVHLALVLLALVLDVEDVAVFEKTRVVGASVDSLLEHTVIPSLDEISVVTGASWITVGDDELAVHASEWLGNPDGLVEESGEAGVEALGAFTAIDLARVGDMGLVVLGVEVLSVPAGWEHDLKTETVCTGVVDERALGESVSVHGGLWRAGVVETVEADGLLAQGRLSLLLLGPAELWRIRLLEGEVTETSISRNHTKASRECLDILSIQEVVTRRTS